MTNIEAGGSTVFPEIGVELKPREVQMIPSLIFF